jgi:hypothetical protein
MLLCGLALAGANLPADAIGRYPRLVTAEEISGWDLSNCELAVLSACDTNVGERRAGQGVASLQKALHMAGARTVITSLWKVPDEATKDLMLDFSGNLDQAQGPGAVGGEEAAARREGRARRAEVRDARLGGVGIDRRARLTPRTDHAGLFDPAIAILPSPPISATSFGPPKASSTIHLVPPPQHLVAERVRVPAHDRRGAVIRAGEAHPPAALVRQLHGQRAHDERRSLLARLVATASGSARASARTGPDLTVRFSLW